MKRHLLELCGAAALVLAALAYAFFQQGGGLLHSEAAFHIPIYLGPGSLLRKLFDPEALDWGNYQARELSYFFDWLDARLLFISFAHGVIHFFSYVHVLAVLVAGLVHWACARRHLPTLDVPTLGLLMALWLTSPMILNSGHLFRSSKALTALGVVLLGWLLLPMLSGQRRATVARIALLALVGMCTAWVDRQGYALVCFCAAVCVGDVVVFGYRASWPAAATLLGVAGLGHWYNHALAPAVIEALNGYRPKFDFQAVDVASVVSRPALERGLTTLLDHVGYQFGSVSPPVAAGFLAAGLVALLGSRARRPNPTMRDTWLPAVVYLAAVIFFVVLNSVMIVRHPALMLPDVHRYYYWIPVSTALLFGSTVVLARVSTGGTRRWVALGHAVLLASNVIAVPRHWAIMEAGHLKDAMALMPAVRRCITDPSPAAEREVRDTPYSWFCEFCRQVAERASAKESPDNRFTARRLPALRHPAGVAGGCRGSVVTGSPSG